MGKWKFYVSGICYGVLDKEDGHIFHQPLNVHTGEFEERLELTGEYGRYREIGKMDPREKLLKAEAYEASAPERNALRQKKARSLPGEKTESTFRGSLNSRAISMQREILYMRS